MFDIPLCAKLSGEHRSGSVQFVCAFHFIKAIQCTEHQSSLLKQQTAERLYELTLSTHNEKEVENISVW